MAWTGLQGLDGALAEMRRQAGAFVGSNRIHRFGENPPDTVLPVINDQVVEEV